MQKKQKSWIRKNDLLDLINVILEENEKLPHAERNAIKYCFIQNINPKDVKDLMGLFQRWLSSLYQVPGFASPKKNIAKKIP